MAYSPFGLLQVIDFPFKVGSDPKPFLQHSKLQSQPSDPTPGTATIDNDDESVPGQSPPVFRVYVLQKELSTDNFPRSNVLSTLENLREKSSYNTSHSLATALSQCQNSSQKQMAWATTFTFYDSWPPSPPSRYDIRKCRRWHLRTEFIRDENDRLQALLSYDNAPPKTYGFKFNDVILNLSKEMSHEMIELDNKYKAVKPDIDKPDEDYLKLFLLRVCHIALSQQRRTVDTFQKYYDDSLDRLSGPSTRITSDFLSEIALISTHAERLYQDGSSLTSAIESMLDTLSPKLKETDPFKILNMELRGLCRDLSGQTSTLAPRLDNRLRFLEISRNIQEASSLWLLSLLAGIFLPLSLASSLLSMQTRLVDLHYLLYDFCGVIVFVGTITVICVRALRYLAQKEGNVHGIFHIRFKADKNFIFLIWALVFSSFLVGMIKEVGLGLQILGYGAATTLVLYLFYLCRLLMDEFFHRHEREVQAMAGQD